MDNPRLRPVEAFPAEYEGTQVIALRDPQGYAEGIVFVPRQALGVLSLFDGEHSIPDIQQVFMQQTGLGLPEEQIRSLIDQLDRYHLLESEGFQAYKVSIERAFREARVRAAAHAGAAYEERAEALGEQLESFFTAPEGPGLIEDSVKNGVLRALMVPHIDLLRGGVSYAHGYKALVESEPADLYVILGVAHTGTERLFAGTQKDFETPLGMVSTDQEFMRSLAERYGRDLFHDEIAHKSEHSIEFQTVFLQHFAAARRPFRIAPILVGSFHELIGDQPQEEKREELESFIEALKQTIEVWSQKQRVCLIASVDLSHVGPRFGDEEELSEVFLQEVKKQDEVFLRLVEAGRAQDVLEMIRAEKDRRNVCGFPAIYTMLRVLEDLRGRTLRYDQWADEATGASVSFASVVFE
jgi:hypothetical protein